MRQWMAASLLVVLAACGGGGMSPMEPADPSPPAAPPPGAVVLRRANLSGLNGHVASGTVEIVRDGTRHTLEFRQDFRIDLGNNDVYLARTATLDRGTDVKVGEINTTSGAHSFALPDAAGDYRYVFLWCRPFQVPIGRGELR